MIVPINSWFGVYEWEKLSRACHKGELTIDLSNVEFAYPPGIVALSLVVNYRGRNGKPTELTVPEDKGVLSYLNRIDFFESLPREVRIYEDLSQLDDHARNPSIDFTEVLVLEEEGIEDAVEVVKEFLRRHVGKWVKPFSIFEEALTNARDHSRASERDRPGGSELKFGALHVQVYEDQLELAVGDIGDGIRGSLNTCPSHNFGRSVDAIRATLEQGASRFPDVPERGGGLKRAKNVVEKMEGELDLRSYKGVGHLSDGQLDYERHRADFPGTLIRFELPSRE